MHDDHLVIHAETDSTDEHTHGPALPHADDIGPSLPLPLSALSSASAVINAGSERSVGEVGSEHSVGDASAKRSEGFSAGAGGHGINSTLAADEDDGTEKSPGPARKEEEEHAQGRGRRGLKTSARPTVPQLLHELGTLQQEASSTANDNNLKAAAAAATATAPRLAARADELEPAGLVDKELGEARTDNTQAAARGVRHGTHSADEAAASSDADPLYDSENPSRPCGKRHPTIRVAMLIPWVNELPPWLAYFITTAQRSAFLVDWLIFHEVLTPPGHLPENVRFIDLGAGGLSQLFGLKMGEELGMPVRNASLLIRSMRFMLEKWPRLVAEYKPAFGSIFEQYIADYSHWGYCDLDMVIGNLPLFLEHRELMLQVVGNHVRFE